MNNDYYKVGDHNVICDVCGKKKKRSECQKTWDNFIVCRITCYDPKHPNEYSRVVIPDGLPVQDARPRPASDFISIQGFRTWSDTALTWETEDWRWDDDPSKNDPTNPTQFM